MWIEALAVTAVGLWSSAKVTLRFLQFFQQEEYDPRRFLAWWRATRSVERRMSLFYLVVSLCLGVATNISSEVVTIVGVSGAFVLLLAGWSLRFSPSKKPLRVTGRLQRLIVLVTLLQGGILLGAVSCCEDLPVLWPLAGLLMMQLTPLAIVAANALLWPVEKGIRQFYLASAKKRLRVLDPIVIGITGSYGKTSTKHLIAQVCQSAAPCLATPGSVNTLMGVTRVIREQLREEHHTFVVEMGAYRRGSIRSLCDLTHPRVAVLTKIGIAHLERFRSIEVVTQAKAELPLSLSETGCLVYNADDPLCRMIASQVSCQTLSFGTDPTLAPLDLWIKQVQPLPEGLDIEWVYQGRAYHALLPLHGLHQAANASAALLVGIACEIPLLQGIASLRSATATPHRCQVSCVNGVTWIDDSYNSNPIGFRNALEVLKSLPGERSFLVTPGMIELGHSSDQEHVALAAAIAQSADHVCLVAARRLQALEQALRQCGLTEERVHCFEDFQAAREWLLLQLKAGDKVLLENDLPDLHERGSAFC